MIPFMELRRNPWIEITQEDFDFFSDMAVEPFHLLILNLVKNFSMAWIDKLGSQEKYMLNEEIKTFKNNNKSSGQFNKVKLLEKVGESKGDEIVIFFFGIRYCTDTLYPRKSISSIQNLDLLHVLHLFLKFLILRHSCI